MPGGKETLPRNLVFISPQGAHRAGRGDVRSAPFTGGNAETPRAPACFSSGDVRGGPRNAEELAFPFQLAHVLVYTLGHAVPPARGSLPALLQTQFLLDPPRCVVRVTSCGQ